MSMKGEQVLQVIVFDWVRHNNLDDVIFHVANERACTPQHGAILKRMGVKSGVSDIIITRARKGYHGAFIELKTNIGRVSPNQRDFLAVMDAEGYFTAVCFGHEECIDMIKWYLSDI